MKILALFLLVVPLVTPDQIEEFTSSTKLLSADVYKQLIADNDNFIVSPFSLETLFGVIQSGAVDATGDEIRTALHFPSTKEETEDVMKSVLPVLENDLETLAAITKLFVQGGTLNEDFENTASEVYQVVFVKTFKRLNVTENYAVLDGALSLIWSNDLAFDQNWAVPFDSADSIEFYDGEETVDVAAMRQEAEYNYYESEELDAKILEVPFVNEEATLTIVLPNQKDGLQGLEEQIAEALTTPEFTKETLEVVLPKFKIPSSIDLTEVAKNLGIKKVFDSAEADLSGISGEQGDIYLRKIKQQIYLDLNELGVGAAVDTQIDAYNKVVSSASKSFTADRPFIFYIKFHDVIIYEGRVVRPQY